MALWECRCRLGLVLNVDVLQLICYVNAVPVPKGNKHKQQRFSSSDAWQRELRLDLMPLTGFNEVRKSFQRHELHLPHKYLNDSRIIKAKVDKWSRKSRFDGGWVWGWNFRFGLLKISRLIFKFEASRGYPVEICFLEILCFEYFVLTSWRFLKARFKTSERCLENLNILLIFRSLN